MILMLGAIPDRSFIITSRVPTKSMLSNDDIQLMAVFSYPADVEEIDLQNVTIYPNPTTGTVFIDLNDIENVEVYNVSGQLEKCYISISNDKTSLTLTKSGVYMIKITIKTGDIVSAKVVVE